MKRHAPATARNSEPLARVLVQELPESGLVLEIASGTGEHAVFMAGRFPKLDWQPTDEDPQALWSVNAWAEESRLDNLRPGMALNSAAPDWPVKRADAVLCVNMIHISPWEATEGLFAGAARLMEAHGPLIVYGPFIEAGVETAPTNTAFDQDLKRRDSRWGLRRLADIDKVAEDACFTRTARYAMPANNLTLVYRRK